MTEQYIGEKKVINVKTIEDFKTPTQADILLVTYDDKTEEQMPKKRFNIIVTDKPTNATTVKMSIVRETASYIFAVMHEFGIKHGEIDNVMDTITQLVNNSTEKATNILFGVDYPDQRTLLNINKILIDNQKNEQGKDTDEPSSDGGGSDSKN